MNFKKTAAIAAAVGALGAVSVPAFALENEFHGMYRLRPMMSNFENAGGGVLKKDAPTLTVFEQRARLQYIAKTSDDLKLVTHFEIDSSWGDTAYQTGRGGGGAMGADSVNLETKNVYLDFNCPLTGANVKAGILPLTDAYKGIFVTDDLGGIVASKKFGAATATGGFFRLQDFNGRTATSTAPAPIGRQTLDLYVLDGRYAVSKDLTLGAAYYLAALDVNYNDQNLHVFGVTAAAKFGAVTADAFLAYQTGDALDSIKAIAPSPIKSVTTGTRDLSAFAAQVAVKADLAKAGAIRANILYASGDDGADGNNSNAWQSVTSADSLKQTSNAYIGTNMRLILRDFSSAMDSDKNLVSTINNNNRGLTLLTLGYDIKLNDKLSASANVGYAAASKKQIGAESASIGTEVNAQVDYKMYSNLTASLQLAYVFLGDGMTTTGTRLAGITPGAANADDPYLTALMLNYSF